ncbi:thermonuclease family protein [Paraurantiacibacter namhicola]|uniref:Succinoglycan biosynthesis protein ExoI n=1 Tax=Paraurantiacibacter namhicola TaxID=645517 RepID=A0A1C7DAV5_9SPHN|nr:thermonuclease family protein [Paraurantiacibacter namhicola]ANU08451.1 Succinoglycan biosynthesis protein ExoI [Paraurantiacibacter namhicola]
MQKSLTLVAALALAGGYSIAEAQVYSGSAVAVDGDTIRIGEERIRLVGIDAPEASQFCERGGVQWQCGADAIALLEALLERGRIECRQIGRDIYQRVLATCSVGRLDLAGEMVGSGLAIVIDESDTLLLDRQDAARGAGLGMWGGTFQNPADFRADKTTQLAVPAPAPAPVARRDATAQPSRTVYYRNCKEARAAGAAPIYRGQPGYRPEMDGDNDGIACEPYRGK